ncbi:S41 family peptidase [Sporosarcina limicola]|uniref:Carboxyl-terminal processing protease n=1 Tax=Sporosarcina limicola TaxID=34101 RepID=A0A927MP76_9BACL|nr:S41 family peptidase [Sporosarcina limicola]MBE1555039.1 carboxyl-terminal processing protease [Sporosarcina limicola]
MRRSRFLLFAIFWVLVTSVILILNGCVEGENKDNAVAQTPTTFGIIEEAFGLIQKKAVYPVDEDMLIEGAVRGMTDSIGDKYSTYFTKDEAAAHKELLAAERVGIGAEITRSNGKFIIVGPVKSSPADKAGLRPYDEIVRIDGERLEGNSLQDIVQRIRGKKGTAVKMTIFRPDEDKHIELSVMRDTIPVKTVSSEVIEDREEKIGYISITTFGNESAKEWQNATNGLIQKGANSLIIDVRGNPGGYLRTVSEIAGSLLPKDTVFAYMQDPKGMLSPLVPEFSDGNSFDEKLKKMPIVLLQDKGSASASEVLSGALKDLKRGFITGTTSFGKGTVQDTFKLSNGGEVKLSTHKWLTPKEQWIHGKGVKADLEVVQSALFGEHIRLVADIYTEGDFHDDIAYGQRLLTGLGYSVGRTDGLFDESTARAVHAFRVDAKVEEGKIMDRVFFTTLKDKVEVFRKDRKNDDQLQMAIGYIHHKISEK